MATNPTTAKVSKHHNVQMSQFTHAWQWHKLSPAFRLAHVAIPTNVVKVTDFWYTLSVAVVTMPTKQTSEMPEYMYICSRKCPDAHNLEENRKSVVRTIHSHRCGTIAKSSYCIEKAAIECISDHSPLTCTCRQRIEWQFENRVEFSSGTFTSAIIITDIHQLWWLSNHGITTLDDIITVLPGCDVVINLPVQLWYSPCQSVPSQYKMTVSARFSNRYPTGHRKITVVPLTASLVFGSAGHMSGTGGHTPSRHQSNKGELNLHFKISVLSYGPTLYNQEKNLKSNLRNLLPRSGSTRWFYWAKSLSFHAYKCIHTRMPTWK